MSQPTKMPWRQEEHQEENPSKRPTMRQIELHPAVPKAKVVNKGKGMNKGVFGVGATEVALDTPAPSTAAPGTAAAAATEPAPGIPMAAAGATEAAPDTPAPGTPMTPAGTPMHRLSWLLRRYVMQPNTTK